MRTVSIKLKDMAIANIQLGFVGENNATQVIFESKEIFDENPYAVQLLVVTPPEGTSYEVTTARIGDNVVWNVSELDTAFEGDGSIQLVFTDGSQVIKTYNADTTVLESQVPSGTAPATALNWIQDAEAWAKGTRGGRAVEDDDPTYQNNSKYYSDKIVNMASDSEAWAKGTRDGEAVESDDPAYHNNSKYYAESIADTASDSEAYAAGTRGGEDVDEDDPAYENNAKYYNEQAALEKAAAQAAAETASAAYNVNLLAANYDATKTYAVGEYVIYSGGLYRCISAITTAEAWTAAHWSSVTVGKDTSALKSAIDYTRDATADAYGVNFFDPFALILNKDLGTNGVAVDSQNYDITDFIDVGNNTKFTFKLFDYTGSVSFTIYQYSNNTEASFIKRTGNGSYLPGRTVNLESTTKYIRFRVEKSAATHINPYKTMCVWGEVTISAFVPYYTAWDKTARTNYADLDSRALQNRLNTGITDADEITDVGYYYLSTNIADNLPETSGAWWLWNTKLNANNMLQQAYEAHGYRAYMRAKVSGSWGAWEQIATDALVKSRLGALYDSSSISLFETVGCCGDSFTAGYLYNKPDSQWYDPNYAPTGAYPRISYGKVMGRLYGLDVTLYAKGGLTSTAWRTDSVGLPALRADDPKDLYIICLGLNDCTNNNVPLGVQADLDTEPQEPTWYGNMGVIIRSIQNHAPMSRIILLKSPWVYRTVGGNVNSHYTYNSEAIEYIKEHLGIPYLETLGDPYFCGTEYIEGVEAHGLHPTAPLYAGMGRRIGELVGQCIIDNPNYFYNFYIPNT